MVMPMDTEDRGVLEGLTRMLDIGLDYSPDAPAAIEIDGLLWKVTDVSASYVSGSPQIVVQFDSPYFFGHKGEKRWWVLELKNEDGPIYCKPTQ